MLQGNTHLWFLPTLFCIFLASWLLEYLSLPDVGKIFLLFILYFISSYVTIALVGNVFQYLIWFYMGYYFERYRERINKTITGKQVVFQIIVCSVLYLGYRVLSKQQEVTFLFLKGMVKFWLVVCLCYLTYQFCYLASMKRTAYNSTWYQLVLRNSMGIYLYSDPLNYAIMFLFAKTLGSFIFTNPFGVIVMVLTRFTVTLWMSTVLTEVLRKCHLKYLC